LLDWAGGWRLGRTPQIQPATHVLANVEAFWGFITIAQASGMTVSKGPGGSLPVEASASIIAERSPRCLLRVTLASV
jgi:hypothetical protein